MTAPGPIESFDVGVVRVLRLRHGRANAIDVELFEALMAALDQATEDGCRALVLTGSGSIFSAGVDLKRVLEEGEEYLRRFVPMIGKGLRRLFAFPRPVVAALNGHAVAGGCIVACACDRRIAAAGDATVGVPELRVGVPYPSTALEILRFVVGDHGLEEVVYSAGTSDLETVRRHGLVDEIVAPETLLERAVAVAGRMAKIAPETFALTKSQIRRPVLDRLAAGAASADREVERIWRLASTREAIRAYVEATLGAGGS
ncbi:MAG: enoyl-CoA hydratase/isomerase family protein [Thermoanaerobaculia bacterium]